MKKYDGKWKDDLVLVGILLSFGAAIPTYIAFFTAYINGLTTGEWITVIEINLFGEAFTESIFLLFALPFMIFSVVYMYYKRNKEVIKC